MANVGFRVGGAGTIVANCRAEAVSGNGFQASIADQARVVSCDAVAVGGDGFNMSSSYTAIVGCQASDVSGDGFHLNGGDYCTISGCMEWNSVGDAFQISGTSERNLITGCVSWSAGAAALHIASGDYNLVTGNLFAQPATYNVLVDTGSTNNCIVNNHIQLSGGSGRWSDAGTGTVNAYPGHGTWGDNFG